jgi:hypothetical protein
MDTHKNAPLTPKGREMMVRAVVDCGLSKPPRRASSTRRRRPSKNESSGSRPRASKACSTAHQGRIHRRAKRRRPSARRSRLCAGSATLASRSPPRRGFRRRPSAAFSSASASTGCRRSSRPSRCGATNEPLPARSSTSTSRSSASSTGSATGSPAIAPVSCPLLRITETVQAGRGYYQETGDHPAPVESDRDGASLAKRRYPLAQRKAATVPYRAAGSIKDSSRRWRFDRLRVSCRSGGLAVRYSTAG